MKIKDLLSSFPKKRPYLNERIKDIYESQYKANRDGSSPATSLAQRLERWMHHRVAESGKVNRSEDSETLELGAGTLNHLPYENSLSNYDIVEPMSFLFQNNDSLSSIRDNYADISDISGANKYDRIISIAVLEHITNLPHVIFDSIKLLKKDGIFSCGIPSEGGFLWGLAWRLSTGLEFRFRYGLDYGELMRYEHVNNMNEIECLLKYCFEEVTIKRFGFGKHLSLYTYLECRKPNQRADEFLSE